MQEKQPEGQQKKHSLLEIKHFPALTWPKFLEKWADPSLELELRIGLLHCGFDIPIDTHEGIAERLLFYFDVADGYCLEENFSENYRDAEKWWVSGVNKTLSVAGIRQLVARKAFQQLCLRFFKNENKESHAPSWAKFLLKEESFNKILWFFRLNTYNGLVNDPYTTIDGGVKEHYKEIVRDFLDRFIFIVWGGFDAHVLWNQVLDVKQYELSGVQ